MDTPSLRVILICQVGVSIHLGQAALRVICVGMKTIVRDIAESVINHAAARNVVIVVKNVSRRALLQPVSIAVVDIRLRS